MLVEIIIDKDEYKQLVKEMNFKASNGIEVSKRSLKANGKDNYYLRLYCSKEDIESARALSEIRCLIEKEFRENGIEYRVLIDESSQHFTNTLYPLIMEFETKLRKFIHNTLFDISEESKKRVIAQLATSLGIKIQDDKIVDFLELSTLEKIRMFLFQNNELYADVKKYMGQEGNMCATKKELIDYISNSGSDTIWNKFFENNFSDSTLPNTFEKIIGYRNDVMHFHYISFQRYDEGENLIKSAIQDLDKQIKKGIVIESTLQNIDTLSSALNYQQSIIGSMFGLDRFPRITLGGYSDFIQSAMSGVSSMFLNNSVVCDLNSDLAKAQNALRFYSPFFSYDIRGINDEIANMSKILPISDIFASRIGASREKLAKKS